MKLPPPLTQYVQGDKPSHAPRQKLAQHLPLWKQEELEQLLVQHGYVSSAGKATQKAASENVIESCEGKLIWNVRNVKKALLAATRKESKKEPVRLIEPKRMQATGPVWTDLENIGTYFGVGKNKIGAWLDQLGLRDYKPMQINESGDVDMLDVANASKEKFRVKIPTEKALENGYAQMEVVDYRGKGGKEKSFEKYSWNRDKVKDLLVRAGHPLDLERKLLNKGRGKNSDIKTESLDDRAAALYKEWQAAYKKDPKNSFRLFERKPTPLLIRVEQLMGRPRYLRDRQYVTEKF